MEKQLETANLTACYGEIKQKATMLAGGLDDIAQRAKMLHALYVESCENHAFANIAAQCHKLDEYQQNFKAAINDESAEALIAQRDDLQAGWRAHLTRTPGRRSNRVSGF
jgi:hypothetical protein